MTRATILVLATTAAFGLPQTAAAQKNKTTCGSDVQVTVGVAGSHGFTGADPLGFALVSDGGGAYVNSAKGSDKITAIFQVNNCTHDFTMNMNFSRRSLWARLVDSGTLVEFVRRVNFFNFDRVASVPVTTGAGFLSSQFCSNGWARNADGSVPKNADGTWRDNYGGCNTDVYGNYVRRAGSMSLDGDERLNFFPSPLNVQVFPCPNAGDPTCEADYVRVYHPSANTWILRPENFGKATYRVWSGGAYLFESHQELPFEITVTRP